MPTETGRTRLLVIAIIGLFAQQTFVAMSRLVLPVLAPVVSEELAINPALIGAYSGILSSAAIVTAMGAGGFIERFGPWRMCQITLIVAAAGFAVALPGTVILFAVSAVLISLGPGVSTAASSHVLARYCPPKQAPFFFSIKQTGVPAGGLLAGALVPLLAQQYGWRGAFAVVAVLYLLLGLALQPFRAEFDGGRHPGHRSFLADARATLRLLAHDSRLREMVVASFTFVGLQAVCDSFFVIYLVKGLSHSLTTAGTVFAVAQGAAIVTRILWGWIAGRVTTPRRVLAGLGLGMAIASTVLGLFSPSWPLAVIIAVAIMYTGTAYGWNGVLLAEIARLAPPDRVGATTGGVLACIMAGATAYPLLFAAIVWVSDAYGATFILVAAPALVVGLRLLRDRRDDVRPGPPTHLPLGEARPRS